MPSLNTLSKNGDGSKNTNVNFVLKDHIYIGYRNGCNICSSRDYKKR
jgi:hypothetical protein